MGRSTFQGPVRSLGGFYNQGGGTTVSITTTPVTLDPETYAGKIIRLNIATAVITLPLVNAGADSPYAGPGPDPNTLSMVGVTFTFIVETAATSIAVKTQGLDRMIGSALSQIAAGTTTGFQTVPATTTTLTMNGGTTGGAPGSAFTLQGLTTNRWLLRDANLIGVGAQVTPFS